MPADRRPRRPEYAVRARLADRAQRAMALRARREPERRLPAPERTDGPRASVERRDYCRDIVHDGARVTRRWDGPGQRLRGADSAASCDTPAAARRRADAGDLQRLHE